MMSNLSSSLIAKLHGDDPDEDEGSLVLLTSTATTDMSDISHVFLEIGLESNIQDQYQQASLISAVRNLNSRMAITLLDNHTNTLQNPDKALLHIAINEGSKQRKTVVVLLNTKNSLNIQNSSRFALLDVAKNKDHLVAMKRLFKNRFNLDIEDQSNGLSFHRIIISDDIITFWSSLEPNANVYIHDALSYTPIYKSLFCKSYATLSMIKHSTDVNIRDDKGQTLLFDAIKNGDSNVVSVLLEHNADVNIKDNAGLTPLTSAIIGQQLEIFLMLLDHNANINIRDNKGNTPLHHAAKCHSINFMNPLINKNAKINVQNEEGQTPLHLASCDKKVIILLNNNADVNILDKNNRTALAYVHYSIKKFGRLKLHVLAMEAAGLYVCPENLSVINEPKKQCQDYWDKVERIRDICRNHLTTLRLATSSITFHKFIIANEHTRANLLNNKDIVKHFRQNMRKLLWNCLMKSRFITASQRNKVINRTRLYRNSRVFQNLPEICIDHICSYLSTDELRKLNVVLQLASLSNQ